MNYYLFIFWSCFKRNNIPFHDALGGGHAGCVEVFMAHPGLDIRAKGAVSNVTALVVWTIDWLSIVTVYIHL